MAKLVDAEFVPVDTPRQIMRGADVVICATSSNVPVFDGTWIEPGQHIVRAYPGRGCIGTGYVDDCRWFGDRIEGLFAAVH